MTAMNAPSLAVRLYGTDEPVEPPRLLTAGPLTAELEAGNLRYVRWRGVEIMRAVSFIVRDRNWGTYNPEISGLTIEESETGFSVRYDAVARDAEQTFRYAAEITGSPCGCLTAAWEDSCAHFRDGQPAAARRLRDRARLQAFRGGGGRPARP